MYCYICDSICYTWARAQCALIYFCTQGGVLIQYQVRGAIPDLQSFIRLEVEGDQLLLGTPHHILMRALICTTLKGGYGSCSDEGIG